MCSVRHASNRSRATALPCGLKTFVSQVYCSAHADQLKALFRGQVRAEIERLLGTPYAENGVQRPLRYGDFIVVAPYNAHVRLLRE